MKVYIDTNDWWIGYYRGEHYHFICPLPTVVIRWNRKPPCSCARCSPSYIGFRVCALCGNKRCPHAADHRLVCTRSNESGQPGSLYPSITDLIAKRASANTPIDGSLE